MAAEGMSQSDLARAIGTRQSTIQGWLGGAMPRSLALRDLAAVFNVSVEWLKCETDNVNVTHQARVAEGPATAYTAKAPDESALMQGLLEKFLDAAPESMLLEMLRKFGEELVTGNARAALHSRVLIDLIRERRPEVFDDPKPEPHTR